MRWHRMHDREAMTTIVADDAQLNRKTRGVYAHVDRHIDPIHSQEGSRGERLLDAPG